MNSPQGEFLRFSDMNIISKIPQFLSEVKTEMKKVSWPTRQQTIKNTLTIIIASAIVAAFLGGLDAFFAWVIKQII